MSETQNLETELRSKLGSHRKVAKYIGLTERTYARARLEGYKGGPSQEHYKRVLEMALQSIKCGQCALGSEPVEPKSNHVNLTCQQVTDETAAR